jgi:sugar phosphate isomerase/epimerase
VTCYSRRLFLHRTAAAAATPALTSFPRVARWLTQADGPHVTFATDPRARISVATYPFRDVIVGSREQPSAGGKKMPLKDFPAHVVARFNIKKIEPWSAHVLSREDAYLDELRNAAEKAGVTFANIAADGRNCIYSNDPEVRRKAVGFGINWIDVAAHLSSPSVRLNIADEKNTQPDAERAAEGFSQIASYAATKNVVVHLENDNPISEAPFFIAALVDRVNNPWLHALPDFGNSLAALPAEQAYKGLDQMFARAYAISHVKDIATTESNTEVHVDLARVFSLAKTHNYKGNFSIEWDSAGDPYTGTTRLIAATIQNLS